MDLAKVMKEEVEESRAELPVTAAPWRSRRASPSTASEEERCCHSRGAAQT